MDIQHTLTEQVKPCPSTVTPLDQLQSIDFPFCLSARPRQHRSCSYGRIIALKHNCEGAEGLARDSFDTLLTNGSCDTVGISGGGSKATAEVAHLGHVR